MKLTLENIESLLFDNPIKNQYCKVLKNDSFIYNFKFDNCSNIIEIQDSENTIAEYVYDDDNFPIAESIKYSNGEIESFYKVEKNFTIFSEYRTVFTLGDKFSSSAFTNIKYKYGNCKNKYLKKYHLDELSSIYISGVHYTVKCQCNGFEVYDDNVMVYKELYNNFDNLIYSYIVDYNCIQNTFKYNIDNKVSQQSVYVNNDLLCKVYYTYENNLLNKESIHYNNSIYDIYYYYNSDGSISKIDDGENSYEFIYY